MKQRYVIEARNDGHWHFIIGVLRSFGLTISSWHAPKFRSIVVYPRRGGGGEVEGDYETQPSREGEVISLGGFIVEWEEHHHKDIRVSLTVNGKDTDPSELSAESWAAIRKA